jgi:hypothetical protein
LSAQDIYTLHKEARKRFPRNSYTLTNIDDVWKADLADLTSLVKYNNGYKYNLNVTDVFSRYVWSFPLKNKTGASVTTALEKLFKERKPLTLQSDKGAAFLNATVQRFLKQHGVSFHTTHNPDIKAAVVERFNRTLETKMYKYFTRKNTYRYVDVLDTFVTAYNSSLHSTIGLTRSQVNPKNIYAVWQRLKGLRSRIPEGRVKFKIDLVRITKEKLKFAKGYEQNYPTEIFRVVKVINRKPQSVYELRFKESANRKPVLQLRVGKSYSIPKSEFQIDKIVRTRTHNDIKQHLLKWKGYHANFNSWVKATDITKI